MASAAQSRIKSISYAKYGYIFIAPFFIVYLFFQLWPLINTFIVGFKGNADTGIDTFVGFANYKDILFGNPDKPFSTAQTVHESFFRCLGNTVILWIGNFIPQIVLSLSLAVWFTEANLKIPGKEFFKIVMYLPNILTAASVAVLFVQLCGQSETNPGAINSLLNKIGIVKTIEGGKVDPIKFIDGIWPSRGVVMFIQTWMWFGNTMIMLMSGIQGINPSLFEAASIDGATSGQVFRKITLPLLTPIMAYTLVTSMIGGLQMFDIPFLYHNGAQFSKHLETVAVYIYYNFNKGTVDQANYGYAGAASIIIFAITACLGAITFYMTRDKDEIAKKKQRKKIAKQLKQESKQFGGFSI
jgi:multiple sugar transport system permease protein